MHIRIHNVQLTAGRRRKMRDYFLSLSFLVWCPDDGIRIAQWAVHKQWRYTAADGLVRTI